ncbi:MAG TPA: GAF domain-containing protein, partial [Vicinamibacteria bacterium]|nr:GAF domain-containing protein [Vicinamibacteria bacterium]
MGEGVAPDDRESRIRRHGEALRRLTRSTSFDQPDLDRAVREIVEVAADTLGVSRASVWLYDDARTSVRCRDLYDREAGRHEREMVLLASEYPAYFRSLAQERSIAARDAHAHPATREFSAGYLTPLGIHAMLDAPIFVAGKMVGVVCHEHRGAPRDWQVEDEQFAASIADMVALALEAGELRQAEKKLQATVEQLRRRLRQVGAMVDLSLSVISLLDVNDVLEKIIDLSREVMNAEASTLLLLDRELGKLRFHAARGSAGSMLKGSTVELGQGLAGWVARAGEPLLVADAYQNPRFDPSYDRLTGFTTRSIMTVPLKTKGEVLGVLQVMNKAGGEGF